MSDADKKALYQQLLRLMARGGKDMDLAVYALEAVEQARYDLRCCCPAVKEIIKKSYN